MDLITLVTLVVCIIVPILNFHIIYVLEKVRRVIGVDMTGTATERLMIAVTDGAGTTGVVIATLNRMFNIWPEANTFILVGSLLLLVAPAAIWEIMFWTGRLDS